MSRRTANLSVKQKLAIVIKAINGDCSISYLARSNKVSRHALKTWIWKYQVKGLSGLEESHTWRRYPVELKQAAVRDYLDHQLSLEECCRKYNISANSVLTHWIDQHTSGKSLKTTRGGFTTMRHKAKKTTLEQRKAIVLDTIKHGKDYRRAVEKYQVSYSQVYNWVRKYERLGIEGLKDHRGHQLASRSLKELTTEQKYQRQLQEFKHQNELLAAENYYLKKLRALGRKQK